MMWMSELRQIWIKRMKGGPMDPAPRVRVVAGKGIVGNANQGGKRQVTIVSNRHWGEVTAPLGDVPDPRLRRANLLVSDIDFADARGKILTIGTVRIRIYGETRPCEQMEDAVPGLRSAMSVPWGGGAFGEILDDGEIAVGDAVTLQSEP
jgi:MOSC domain-containing protein YiiM